MTPIVFRENNLRPDHVVLGRDSASRCDKPIVNFHDQTPIHPCNALQWNIEPLPLPRRVGRVRRARSGPVRHLLSRPL